MEKCQKEDFKIFILFNKNVAIILLNFFYRNIRQIKLLFWVIAFDFYGKSRILRWNVSFLGRSQFWVYWNIQTFQSAFRVDKFYWYFNESPSVSNIYSNIFSQYHNKHKINIFSFILHKLKWSWST